MRDPIKKVIAFPRGSLQKNLIADLARPAPAPDMSLIKALIRFLFAVPKCKT